MLFRSSMAPKRYPPDDPREWLNRARLKAVFIHRRASFPYVHDLDQLVKLLERTGVKIPKYIWQADELSPFAFETRYPGHFPPVKPRQHRRAVRNAESVLRWAERQIGKP